MADKPNADLHEQNGWDLYKKAKARANVGATVPGNALVPATPLQGEVVELNAADAPPFQIALPRILEEQEVGILQRIQTGSLKRRAACKQLQQVLDAESDHLGHILAAQIKARQIDIDLKLREYAEKRNADLVRILDTLKYDNVAQRMHIRIKFQDLKRARVKEVIAKDWDDDDKVEVIADLVRLEKRATAEILDDSGSKYLDD